MQLPETVEVTNGRDTRSVASSGCTAWAPTDTTSNRSCRSCGCRQTLPLRFIFPHAPVRPVTINGGMAMRAWYDILSLDSAGRADAKGVLESTALLEALVDREIERGIEAGKIVIAGFSQGGAIAINAALHARRRLAGLMAALDLYRAAGETSARAPGHGGLPVFMAHGSLDPMLPMQWGRASADKLIEAGFAVEWHDYPMAHAVCPEEIMDIRTWLLSVLG